MICLRLLRIYKVALIYMPPSTSLAELAQETPQRVLSIIGPSDCVIEETIKPLEINL